MKCIHCGAWTRVTESRPKGDFVTRRLRVCANACAAFPTFELLAPAYSRVQKEGGYPSARAAARKVALHRRNRDIQKRHLRGETSRAIATHYDIDRTQVNRVVQHLRTQSCSTK